jgi:regulatory protein
MALKTLEEQIKYYCAYQERCHHEVRYKLVELGARGLQLENLIGILIDENFLNEERFAKLYAGSKFRQLHWGKVKIKQELTAKKISAYCLAKGLAEISDADYLKTCKKLAEKKWETLKTSKLSFAKIQKVKMYLLQKGYEPQIVQQVLQVYMPKK